MTRPLLTCQCPAVPEQACTRLATQEDLRCDTCRPDRRGLLLHYGCASLWLSPGGKRELVGAHLEPIVWDEFEPTGFMRPDPVQQLFGQLPGERGR